MSAHTNSLMPGVKDPNDEFPILCETCLGDNPFVRMTKQPYAYACKICERPFTVYRWKPGTNARYKKTELCHTCAKMKNVCQTCVLDLQFGLPVQVRDNTLQDHEKMNMPEGEINREYMLQNMEKDMTVNGTTYGKVQADTTAYKALSKIRKKTPYYKRNESHLCSFFAKGTCNRGKLCPYRHEMPKTGPLAKQNIKDRYYGQNDPVAEKILKKQCERADVKPLVPPDDVTVTTLWVGGVQKVHTDMDLRSKFGVYGEISSIRMVFEKKCAFITYMRRSAAEDAAKNLNGKLEIKGTYLRLAWGKKQAARSGGSAPPGVKGAPSQFSGPPPPGMRAASTPGLTPIHYPSQDPSNMAARFATET